MKIYDAMTDLITEARELCEKAMALEIPTERLDYSTEYVPLVDAIHIIPELCDALGKAEEQNKQFMHEVCKLARESVKREKNLARLEAEVMAARDSMCWIPVTERLPDNAIYDWVLVQITEDNGYMWIPKVAEYREQKKDWYCHELGWLKDHEGCFAVTHWRPLPEPPEDKPCE